MDPIGAWLDGADPKEVGLRVDDRGRVRLYAQLATELSPERVDEFAALGLDAEPWLLAIPGSLVRDQAREVLAHEDVIGLSPIGASQLSPPHENHPAPEERGDA